MRGHSYTVAGGKGGVGKTTTVVNVATALRDRGHEVVVVDADLAMTNLGAVLGVDHEPTLHDVLAEDASIDGAITTVDGLTVLPGDPAIDRCEAAKPGNLRTVVEQLERRFEIVLVDTGAGLTHESMVPFAACDAVVLVTTPDDTRPLPTPKRPASSPRRSTATWRASSRRAATRPTVRTSPHKWACRCWGQYPRPPSSATNRSSRKRPTAA